MLEKNLVSLYDRSSLGLVKYNFFESWGPTLSDNLRCTFSALRLHFQAWIFFLWFPSSSTLLRYRPLLDVFISCCFLKSSASFLRWVVSCHPLIFFTVQHFFEVYIFFIEQYLLSILSIFFWQNVEPSSTFDLLFFQ